jgi:hypothetical protein
MSFFKNLFNEVAASVKAAVSSFRKPKEGVPETSFDYRKPNLRGYMLQRTGKHRGTKGAAPDQAARIRRRFKTPLGAGSYAAQDAIMGALLRGEIDVARRLIKGENVKMMPRRIRDFAAAQLA